jgi:hypothetical protein
MLTICIPLVVSAAADFFGRGDGSGAGLRAAEKIRPAETAASASGEEAGLRICRGGGTDGYIGVSLMKKRKRGH